MLCIRVYNFIYNIVPAQVEKNARRISYSKSLLGTLFKPQRRQLVLVLLYICECVYYALHCMSAYIYVSRGAEAGGILGVNTPHSFRLTTPTFWRDLKMGAGEKFRR